MAESELHATPIGRGSDKLDLRFAGWNASLLTFVSPHENLVLRLAHIEGAGKLGPEGIEEVFIGFIGGFPRLPRWKVSSFHYHYDADLDQYVMVDRQADIRIAFGKMIIGQKFDEDEFATRGVFCFNLWPKLYDSHPEFCKERGYPTPDEFDAALYE